VINPTSKPQIISALAATMLTAAAISVALLPAVIKVTTIALPIALGVGALIAWVVFLALAIKGCSHTKPEKRTSSHPEDPPVSNDDDSMENQPGDLSQFCEKLKNDLINSSKMVELERKNAKAHLLLVQSLENTCLATLECAKGVTDHELLKEIKHSFVGELKSFHSFASTLLEDKKEASIIEGFITIYNLLQNLRSQQKRPAAEDFDSFKNALDKIGDINHEVDDNFNTPLMLLAKIGWPSEFVQILADRKADFNVKDQSFAIGNTPLLWAIANANNEMAFELIKHMTHFEDMGFGNTALILAIAKGYTDQDSDGKLLTVSNAQLVAALLKKGANPNQPSKAGMTPLRLAIIRRNPEMVESLLKAGATLNFNWKELLGYSYSEAKSIVGETSSIGLIDEASFNASKQKIGEILKKNPKLEKEETLKEKAARAAQEFASQAARLPDITLALDQIKKKVATLTEKECQLLYNPQKEREIEEWLEQTKAYCDARLAWPDASGKSSFFRQIVTDPALNRFFYDKKNILALCCRAKEGVPTQLFGIEILDILVAAFRDQHPTVLECQPYNNATYVEDIHVQQDEAHEKRLLTLLLQQKKCSFIKVAKAIYKAAKSLNIPCEKTSSDKKSSAYLDRPYGAHIWSQGKAIELLLQLKQKFNAPETFISQKFKFKDIYGQSLRGFIQLCRILYPNQNIKEANPSFKFVTTKNLAKAIAEHPTVLLEYDICHLFYDVLHMKALFAGQSTCYQFQDGLFSIASIVEKTIEHIQATGLSQHNAITAQQLFLRLCALAD
jgi:ankyrin repeat protein